MTEEPRPPAVRKWAGIELRFTLGNVVEIVAFLVAGLSAWYQLGSDVRDHQTRLETLVQTQNRDRSEAKEAITRVEQGAASATARLERTLDRLDTTLAHTNQTLAGLVAAVEAIRRASEPPSPRR